MGHEESCHRQYPLHGARVFRAGGEGPGAAGALARRRSWRQRIAVGLAELALAALVCGIFWHQDWRYSLPTPKPRELRQPPIGTRLEFPERPQQAIAASSDRPMLLHF